MRKILVVLGACALTLAAHAEIQTVTIIAPTQKVDNSTLDLANLVSWRLQCGIGPASPVPWIINDEIPFPTTSKDYDFKPNGQWNCHAWVTTNYSCASMVVADGTWTFGTGGDQYGNEILLNGDAGVNGSGIKLVFTGGKTWALAGKGLDPAGMPTWWRWDSPTSGWAGPLPDPMAAPDAPQLTPATPPLCMSADTPDLVFKIPMNAPLHTSNAKPGTPSISITPHPHP